MVAQRAEACLVVVGRVGAWMVAVTAATLAAATAGVQMAAEQTAAVRLEVAAEEVAAMGTAAGLFHWQRGSLRGV